MGKRGERKGAAYNYVRADLAPGPALAFAERLQGVVLVVVEYFRSFGFGDSGEVIVQREPVSEWEAVRQEMDAIVLGEVSVQDRTIGSSNFRDWAVITFVPLGRTTYDSFEDSFSTARMDRSSMIRLTLHSSSASASNL